MKTVTYEADLSAYSPAAGMVPVREADLDEHKRGYPNAPIYRVVTVSVTTKEKIA